MFNADNSKETASTNFHCAIFVITFLSEHNYFVFSNKVDSTILVIKINFVGLRCLIRRLDEPLPLQIPLHMPETSQ